MSKKNRIPVHRMDDKFSGVYLKSFDAVKSAGLPHEENTQPHRHDFYYCVLMDKGEMELLVDFEKVQLTDQSLFLSYPGQINQVVSARSERGWFLAFEPSMLDEQLIDILDQCLSQVILVPLTLEQTTGLSSFIKQLHAVYEDQTQLFRQALTKSIVIALVYQIASAYMSMEKFNLARYSARSIEITKNFKQLLRRDFKTMKRPSEFADRMSMTVSYLNDTVRTVTGFPATYHIQQELMREAQRLLAHSDLSVKEIADTLGFEDAKYFNRLFSKVIGLAPGAFRKASETALHL